MRERLSVLTRRGRVFLVAGVAAVLGAVVLGQPALARAGVLVLALPLVTALVMSRSRYRLSLSRDLSPHLVAAGRPARVVLSLANRGRAPGGTLLLEDRLPYVLGPRPRFVLARVGRGWQREVSYPVRSDVRGRFTIGPMTIRVQDPFGLVELGRAFQTTSQLLVTPATVPLAPIGLVGAGDGTGDDRPRSFATGSAEDITVRDYRRGDDLRRVHWRSSARTGELMVRREEQPWHARATVFLDNRAAAHVGSGVTSSLEVAVSAAASVAVHLAERGYAVRLVTAGGDSTGGRAQRRHEPTTPAALLEALALVEATDGVRLGGSGLTEATDGGLVVGVFGALETTDLPVVRRIRHGASGALAFTVDRSAWTPGGPDAGPASSATALLGQGWRVSTLSPTTEIDQAWLALAQVSPGGTRPARRTTTAGQR